MKNHNFGKFFNRELFLRSSQFYLVTRLFDIKMTHIIFENQQKPYFDNIINDVLLRDSTILK